MRLTIICPTYNHERYIAKALRGFVGQKTNFPFKALVVDDASTDKTAAIIKDYATRYPEIIKPVLRLKNIGPVETVAEIYDLVDTDYVIWCEGDDYWVNDNFLQKAVDFLDQNKEFMIFAGDTAMHSYISNGQIRFGQTIAQKTGDGRFSFHNFFYLHLSARVFRNIKPLPRGDMAMLHFLLLQGPGWYHNECVSIYNYSGNGAHSAFTEDEQLLQALKGIYQLNKFFNFKLHDWYVSSTVKKKRYYQFLELVLGRKLAWSVYAWQHGFWNRDQILVYG
ncbi:hypothetical protein FACS189460_4030 [Deltaproteobacteria bacterium]|nr:hypothetical protein FACS189460_4030 [Deltaproteobacteria bacterium]